MSGRGVSNGGVRVGNAGVRVGLSQTSIESFVFRVSRIMEGGRQQWRWGRVIADYNLPEQVARVPRLMHKLSFEGNRYGRGQGQGRTDIINALELKSTHVKHIGPGPRTAAAILPRPTAPRRP